VFASEHVAGREHAAAALLAAELPADKIIRTLAKLPEGQAAGAMLGQVRRGTQDPAFHLPN
jgi:hypothetical protein